MQTRFPFQRRGVGAFSPNLLSDLARRRISARVEDYGKEFDRFEADLEAGGRDLTSAYPLVCVPETADTNWQTGGLSIRPRTFVVVYQRGETTFVTRRYRSREVVSIPLSRFRLMHRAWRDWPVVLPSMLLTVLWHVPTGK